MQKYSKLYSPEFLNNLKMIFSNPKFQQLVQRDLDSQSTLLKKYKNLKVSYHKELVLLMHRRLRSRFVITQFIKKDLFNNLFWIVLVSVSAAMNRSYDTYKLSNSFDLTFVIKIFNNRYQKSHMNQETLNLRNFERQLQMRLKMTKLIKNLLITGHLPVPMKKILKESLSNDLNIIDSKIRLKHHGELSSINEQEFFQQNVEKKFNKINKNTLLFTKRKAVITDPINELFENTFVEIYNKDFTQKREENFDTFYENEEKVDNDLDEEIQDLKNKIKYPTKYGHLEVIQEEDVEFIQNREVLNVNSETLEHSEKENLNFPSSISVNMTYYLKIRLNPGLNILFLRIIIVPMLDTTILHFSIYAPWNRFITYGRIEDKKMIIILMRILKMKNIKLKKVKLANILQFQSRVHGFSYMFLNKKKEKEFGASKKTLIFSSDISMRSHLIKNSEELQMKFQHKTLHFLIKLPKIGKANVTMNVYSCENLLEAFQENSLLICFQINYYYSRTKALKLILNRDDLSEIFKMETGKPMTTAIFLNKVRELLKQISFIRQKLYSSPQFIPKFEVPRLDLSSSPLIKKHSGNRQHVDLEMLRWHKNNFTKHDLGKTQTNLTKGYLEQYIKDTRIIGQFIKKIRSDFILVTVCKHMILDYWVLYSYVPKNSRYYVCYITNSDLLYMDIKDLSDIYPAQIYEQCISTSTKRAFTNYRSFFKKYKGGVEDNSDGDNNVKERKTGFQLSQLAKYQSEENNESSKKEIGHIVNSFKNKKMRKVMKIKKITDLTEKMSFAARKSLPHVRYHNLYNFIEFYIWENFIKKIDLKSLEDNSWFFTLRKFKVHLKQVLYTNYVKIDKYNDAQIEIFILLNREKERETVIKDEKETNQEKESEKENNIKNRESKFKEKYNEKLRRKVKDRINENHKSENEIDFGLKNVEIKNQTTNFNSKEKESLFSPFEPIGYAATSNHNILIRYLSLNKLSIQFEKINLREIINLFIADGFHKFQTNYMNSKFYLSDLQNLCNFIIYKIKSSNFANLIHDNSSKKKHHASKNTQYFNRMVETEDGSEIPIIQQIFNRKPLQIINFRFHLEEKLLSAVIYKKTSCQSITREYKFEALKDVIFFFDEMLKNQLYKEICNRLLKVIGNILSIDVNFEFMLLDKNDD